MLEWRRSTEPSVAQTIDFCALLGWACGPRKLMKNRLADVAHALLRAASAVLPTPAAQGAERRVRLDAARRSACATRVLFRLCHAPYIVWATVWMVISTVSLTRSIRVLAVSYTHLTLP